MRVFMANNINSKHSMICSVCQMAVADGATSCPSCHANFGRNARCRVVLRWNQFQARRPAIQTLGKIKKAKIRTLAIKIVELANNPFVIKDNTTLQDGEAVFAELSGDCANYPELSRAGIVASIELLPTSAKVEKSFTSKAGKRRKAHSFAAVPDGSSIEVGDKIEIKYRLLLRWNRSQPQKSALKTLGKIGEPKIRSFAARLVEQGEYPFMVKDGLTLHEAETILEGLANDYDHYPELAISGDA
jgi:hypothetical protein